MNLVDLKNVSIGFSRTNTIHASPINASIPDTPFTAIVGRNGSGKTTLLRSILGEGYLQAGEIQLGGTPVSKIPLPRLSELVAYLPQEQIAPVHLRLHNFLGLAFLNRLGFFGEPTAQQRHRLTEMATRFHLDKLLERRLWELSTGERQKAFLLRMLLQDSRILLMDEPTNHLDPAATREFWDLLKETVEKEKVRVIASTHDLQTMSRHASWVVALGKEGLLFSGPAPDFFPSRVPSIF